MDINGNYIQNQFCSYEIALKLKELGFDEKCLGKYYTLNGRIWQFATNSYFDLLDETYDIGKNFWINTPLWQQCVDWFREEHGIVIEITRKLEVYISNITEQPIGHVLVEDLQKGRHNLKMNDDICPHVNYLKANSGKYLYYYEGHCSFILTFPTYQKAREQAILKCIELLKNK